MGNKNSTAKTTAVIKELKHDVPLKCISSNRYMGQTYITMIPTKKYKGHIFKLNIWHENDLIDVTTEDVEPKLYMTKDKKLISYDNKINNMQILVRCDEYDILQEITYVSLQ